MAPCEVSTASLWEIAVKSALGELNAPDDLPQRVEELSFEQLGITVEHALAVRHLPYHHGDPFDRLPMVTIDPSFAVCPKPVVGFNVSCGRLIGGYMSSTGGYAPLSVQRGRGRGEGSLILVFGPKLPPSCCR